MKVVSMKRNVHGLLENKVGRKVKHPRHHCGSGIQQSDQSLLKIGWRGKEA